MVKNKSRNVRLGAEKVLPKIWDRGKLIENDMVGSLIQVHTGRSFIILKISSSMVGYKLGNFVWTRKARVEHKKKS